MDQYIYIFRHVIHKLQVKVYLHSERFRLKFCWESVTLRVLDVLLFSTENQMEPLVPNVISYDTRPTRLTLALYTFSLETTRQTSWLV